MTGVLCTAVAASPGSMPAGSFAGTIASAAISFVVMVRFDFDDENTPSAKLMSLSSSLSACAAILIAFSITFSLARKKAAPPMVAEREPPVPSPYQT